MKIQQTINDWHEILQSQNTQRLADILAEDVTFHSPILHRAQEGKQITTMYLTAAFFVFYNPTFTYVREVLQGNNAVLEFTTEIDGIIVNGVDMIRCNEEGKIVDFKVMVRPLKAIQLIHQKMMLMLENLK